MKNYREMRVWEKAHGVAVRIYEITQSFPNSELYGLTSQLRRAAVSIAANLAEGCGKSSDSEFGRYVDIASGSASEADYLVLLAKDLGYISPDAYGGISEEITAIRKMLTSLKKAVKTAKGK
jgi:four helix bundle protein